MSSVTNEKLFPIRLEAFDQMMLDDDCRAYPMSFPLVTEFSGEADRDRLRAAIEQAASRHPLFEARLGTDRKGRPVLQAADQASRVEIVFTEFQEREFPISAGRIKQGSDPGLRVLVEIGGGQTRITFVMNHVVTDGMGGYRFIGDVLGIYGNLTGGIEQGVVVPLDSARLKTRSQSMTKGPDQKAKMLSMAEALTKVGAPLFESECCYLRAAHNPNFHKPLQAYPSIVKHAFDLKEFHAIRKAAEKQGVFPHDFLLMAAFKLVADWNRGHGSMGKKPIRLCVPVDLRQKGDDLMPAANVVSLTFMVRRKEECESDEALLDWLREESRRHRSASPGAHLIQTLTMAYSVPGILATVLRGTSCLSTLIVSNIGDPTRRFTSTVPRVDGKMVAGNLTLEEIYGISPLRHGTRLAIGVQSYNRKLLLTMRSDPYRYTVADTQQMMTMLASSIRDLVAKFG
jgi:NRPS condensation-like uncharacterized protein